MNPVDAQASEPAQGRVVGVAYSGGRDSTALLHAAVRAAARLGLRVVGLHIHHGLSAHADEWLRHCHAQCLRWQRRGWPVAFAFEKLSGGPARGESVEAWAREHRYSALQSLALDHGADLVLLAQHRHDQAETFLLQALRGAGMAGLAGMPRQVLRGGITWARPWLNEPRDSIDAYVRRFRLAYVDDDSNADIRFARNRLRRQVWPALLESFPQSVAALAMSAEWANEASLCLQELAALDLRDIADEKGRMNIGPWQRLSAPRRANALRAWLNAKAPGAAGASLTSRLLSELPTTRTGQWPCSGGTLRLYRGTLSFDASAKVALSNTFERHLSVLRSGDYKLPGWGGQLSVRRCKQGGVPLAWLASLELRPRSGGERFQAGIGRPPRSLKKQFQAAAIASWSREGPLFFSGGQLVFVPGLGLDARVLALPGQAQVSLDWRATD